MTGRHIKRGGLWLARGMALTLLAVLVAAFAVFLYLRGALPQTEGTARLQGLSAPVEILRDSNGVPSINARSEEDAYRALGYLHAQDRLWQMDSMRRIAAGRLSEVVGSSTLDLDRMMRGLGLHRVAEAVTARLSEETRAVLEAYAEGVNAYLSDRSDPLPAPFQLLDYEPEPWRPADSIVWGNLMALQLSGDWREELLRLGLLRRLGTRGLELFWPGTESQSADALTDGPGVGTLQALTSVLPWPLAPKSASNWWILSGERSTTGLPLLANDPHLALNSPSTWYLARMTWPGRVLAGATAPGVPFPIIGHNGEIAWGFTTTHSDTQDLFIERLNGEGTAYETENGWEPLEVREEVISSADGPDVTVTLRRSRHGPLISDAVVLQEANLGPREALALSWPLYDADNRNAEAFHRLTKANGREEFLAALQLMTAPQQNVAYADREGGIGFISAGRTPIRKAGDGSLPQPGWTGEFGWQGYIPYAALPQAFNPPEGLLFNANNRIVDQSYPYFLARSFPDPGRAERIAERLSMKQRFTPREAAEIQLDSYSRTAEELLPLMLSLLPGTDRRRPEIAALEGWNFQMRRDRVEPLIVAAWLRAAMQRLLEDETGPFFNDLARPDRRLLRRILTREQEWCDDVTTANTRESCGEALSLALADALALLEERLGKDRQRWRWGALHVAPFRHPVYGRVPLAADLLSLAVETDGWDNTINRGGTDLGWDDPRRLFEHRHGAALRVLFDLSNLDDSLFMMAPGQSDNPLSPYYGNFVSRWQDGLYVKLVGKATEQSRALLLTPVQ